MAEQIRRVGVSEMWRLRQLEEQNRRLKSIVADQALGHPGGEGRAVKKRLRPAVKREMVVEVNGARANRSVAPAG